MHTIIIYEIYRQNEILSTLATEFATLDSWYADVPGPTEPNRLYSWMATSQGLGNDDHDRLAEGFMGPNIWNVINIGHIQIYQQQINGENIDCSPSIPTYTNPINPNNPNSQQIPIEFDAVYVQPGDPGHSISSTTHQWYGPNATNNSP